MEGEDIAALDCLPKIGPGFHKPVDAFVFGFVLPRDRRGTGTEAQPLGQTAESDWICIVVELLEKVGERALKAVEIYADRSNDRKNKLRLRLHEHVMEHGLRH